MTPKMKEAFSIIKIKFPNQKRFSFNELKEFGNFHPSALTGLIENGYLLIDEEMSHPRKKMYYMPDFAAIEREKLVKDIRYKADENYLYSSEKKYELSVKEEDARHQTQLFKLKEDFDLKVKMHEKAKVLIDEIKKDSHYQVPKNWEELIEQ